jgi:membrane protease YdiL (CAAX protease family)
VLISALVLVATAASMTIATRENLSGTAWVFLVPAVPYTIFTIVAVLRMKKEGRLAERLRPRSGDLTFGFVVALMLIFGAIAGQRILAPHGSVRVGWLMRLYQQIGDPDVLQQHMVGVSLAVVAVACLEEITWRGLVFPALEDRFGTRTAFPATAILYATAHLPTMFILRGPFAGPNPLVVTAALGCGLVWGLIVARTGRLPVAMISHSLFTLAVAIHFPLWQLAQTR